MGPFEGPRIIGMRDLSNKVTWITGAGTGIGEGAARALAAAGMRVVLSGRRERELERVARALGVETLVLPLDVSDKAAVLAARDRILARFGRIDVLVNSAGLNARNRHWHHVSLEDWDRVIRIDLDGAFYCARAVLPTMVAQKDGLIVNVSSWAGKYPSMLTGPAYSAAKHALNALSESLNMEAGIHGVRCTALCPGEVATPILDNRPVPTPDEEKARMVQPVDCGEIVAFLARMPAHVCINELTVSPTWNRTYVQQALAVQKL